MKDESDGLQRGTRRVHCLCHVLFLLIFIRLAPLFSELLVVWSRQLELGQHEERNDKCQCAESCSRNEYYTEPLSVCGNENGPDPVGFVLGDCA